MKKKSTSFFILQENSFFPEQPHSDKLLASKFAAISCRSDGLSLPTLCWLKTSASVAKQAKTSSVYKNLSKRIRLKLVSTPGNQGRCFHMQHVVSLGQKAQIETSMGFFITAVGLWLNFSGLPVLIKQQMERAKPTRSFLLGKYASSFLSFLLKCSKRQSCFCTYGRCTKNHNTEGLTQHKSQRAGWDF